MLRVAARSLLARRLRLVLTALSVALGVTLVSGAYVFTDTINGTFDRIFKESYSDIDAVLTPRATFGDEEFFERTGLDDALLERVRRVEGVAEAEGGVFRRGTVLDKEGEPVATGGAPMFIASSNEVERFQSLRVVEGRRPAAPGEAAIMRATAERFGFEVGDEIAVQGEAPRRDYRIVGLAQLVNVDSFGGATIVMLTLGEAQRALAVEGFDEIDVAAQPGTDPQELIARLQKVAGKRVTVRSGADEARSQSADIREDLGFLQTALLAFAGIALFVGAFLIFNTFSITVAQRTREFGLLRTLGASRGQVLRVVLGEGLVLGVLGSAVGLGLGVFAASGIRALFDAVGVDLPSQGNVLLARTVVISLAVGVVVTAVAAIAPAIRATRVPPVAALREGIAPERAHRSRVVGPLGAVLAVAGAALMSAGLFVASEDETALSLLGAGAAAAFLGVALLSPRLVPPLAAVLGRPLARLGFPGHLARLNSARQPGRTAVTAAALMIGIALVSFASIFAAGAKEFIARSVDTGTRAQAVVQNKDGFTPFSGQATDAVAGVPGVARVAALRFVEARLKGEPIDVTGVHADTIGELFATKWVSGDDSTWTRLGTTGVVADREAAQDRGIEVGERVTLRTSDDRTVSLEVIGLIDDDSPLLSELVVSNELVSDAWGTDRDAFVLIGYEDGRDPMPAIQRAVAQDFPQVEALTNEEFKDDQAGQVDQALGLIYALLSLSIVVSLFGIVNTLVLSITERTRELGLLRAVGATRRQVKRMIRAEAVIVALIGSILGLAMGIVLALLVTSAIEEFTLTIPWLTLAIVLLLGGLAGVLAAILPARRAARLDVLEALAYE